MKKYRDLLWILLFFIITVSPGFTYFFFGRYVDSKNYENRNLASRPVLTIENYELFPREYEAYYNDNIPFRNQLIRFNSSIDYFLFNQSSNKSVIIGKEGWLFYRNPMEQSLGYWNFTDDQLEMIADNLMSTKRVLESMGIEFVLFIAPNKESVYIEKLPDYYEAKKAYTSADQVADYLMKNTDVRVVCSKQYLLNTKKENPDILLYHRLDTHWNNCGSYIGTKRLAEELRIDMPSFNEVFWKPVLSSSGDLADMLGITIKDGNIDYKPSGINELATERGNWDLAQGIVYHTIGADSRRLFVSGDSFSLALAPRLAKRFENSVWVMRDDFNQQQIFDFDSDIFVIEIVERNIEYLKNFRVSFLSSSIEKGEDNTKRILMMPAIDGYNLRYSSIFKKNDETGEVEPIQVLEPFNEQMVLEVSGNETGEVYVYIFADKLGKDVLEEIRIEY